MTNAIERCRLRKIDVNYAILNAMGYSDLGDLWCVSTPAAWMWCHKRLSPETCAKLAENGRLRSGIRAVVGVEDRAPWSLRDRLELIQLARAAKWPDSKLARAMGLRPSALCEWLKRNAPDGLADALADFEEAEQVAA